MSDFDELMRVYGLDERMFALGRLSKKERDKSRTALADAISAVTSERDALLKITDVPEGQGSAFYSCDKCGNYLPRVSALERQLKEANAVIEDAINSITFNGDGHMYNTPNGWKQKCEGVSGILSNYVRARLAKGNT